MALNNNNNILLRPVHRLIIIIIIIIIIFFLDPGTSFPRCETLSKAKQSKALSKNIIIIIIERKDLGGVMSKSLQGHLTN